MNLFALQEQSCREHTCENREAKGKVGQLGDELTKYFDHVVANGKEHYSI